MIENLDKLSKLVLVSAASALTAYVANETIKEISKNDPELGEKVSSFFVAGIKAVAKNLK